MKRVSRIICLLLLVFLVIQFAYAENMKTHYFKNMDMSVDIPSDYLVFNKQADVNSKVLSSYGYSSDDIAAIKNSLNEETLLIGVDKNHTICIGVMAFSLYSDSRSDSARQNDDELLKSENPNSYSESGISLDSYEVFYHSQTKFVKKYLSFTPDGNEVRRLIQYSTVWSGNVYIISLRSYTGSIDNHQESIITSVVNSVRLGVNEISSSQKYYHDKKSDLYFAIPENWNEDTATPKGEGIDAILITDKKKGLSIHFGSMDVWENLSASERIGITRKDINNSAFSSADIASSYRVSEKNVRNESHNGLNYYMIESTYTNYGITISTITAVRFENGFMYTFMFAEPRSSLFYTDFISLLNSASYKSISSATKPTTMPISATTKPTISPTKETIREMLYKDSISGLQFSIPSHWREVPLAQETEVIKANFVNDDEPGLTIHYGFYDVWSAMSAAEKANHTRNEIGMSSYSQAEIAKMLGVSEKKITTVTYNGRKYYKAEIVSEAMGETSQMIVLYRIANGYMYQFYFSGTSKDKQYADFISLVNSAVYAEADTTMLAETSKPIATVKPTTSATQNASNNGNGQSIKDIFSSDSIKWASVLGIILWSLLPGFIANRKGRSFIAYFLLSFVLTPLVATIITLCLSNKNKVKSKDREIKNEPLPPSSANNEEHEDDVIASEAKMSVNDHSVYCNVSLTPDAYSNKTEETSMEETKQSVDILFCRYCGFKLLEESDYCSHCGKRVK